VVHLLIVALLAMKGVAQGGSSVALLVASAFAESAPPPTEVHLSPVDLPPQVETATATAVSVGEASSALAIDGPTLPAQIGPVAVPGSGALSDSAPAGGLLGMVDDVGLGGEFFGVPSRGQSFVYLVDSSGSMNDGRLELAKRELVKSVRQLGEQRRFYVVFFDRSLHRLRLWPSAGDEERPVAATADHLRGLETWVATIGPAPGRHPMEALELALTLLPDAIYLLSDGDFPDWIVTRTEAMNRVEEPAFGARAQVPIHTIVWLREGRSSPAAAGRMQKLAQASGGTFRAIRVPAAAGRARRGPPRD
jgi:hypothetical protein